jgi:2-methylcitrate dehydratase
MTVTENPDYTQRYRDPRLRANPNGMEIVFKDGSSTGYVERENPIGHPSRRAEGIPLLINKFSYRLERHYPTRRLRRILSMVANQERFLATPVTDFTDLLTP